MRFSLQDVKKQVQRRGEMLYVRLHFLRPGELHSEIQRLIVYHEQQIGQPRRRFSLDDARACVSDYRFAHCLISTLSAWYHWRQCNWFEVLQQSGGEARECLDAAGITSPVYLRLALFNYVNEQYAGFLDTEVRPEALQAFATLYQLRLTDLEYLLVLDSDEEEVLARDASHPPTAQEVATLYNQWVFEAALFHASDVHFVIDCNTFEQVDNAGHQSIASPTMGTGVGAVIKRLCYLARLLGVYYDLSYDLPSSGRAPVLHLTLYGPQEMTGAPQQYGLRLARLCRLLLGYGATQREQTEDLQRRNKARSRAAESRILTSAIVEAEANVHFLQRSYHFIIDKTILSLLPPIETALAKNLSEGQGSIIAQANTPAIFDSSIEQSFAEAFTALEKSTAVDGWKLLREPEPLLLDSGIFIPDFAFIRAGRRIYVEILGFWTPTYRERKIRRLQQLQERKDIVLAIPVEAKDAFASIATKFPIVWYDGQLSASELLNLLRGHYDDFAERLAQIDAAAVRARIDNENLLPERICYEVLHCYRRSELPLAAEHVMRMIGEDVHFVRGIGFYRVDWMEQLRASFVEWIGTGSKQPLTDVFREMRTRWSALAGCEDAALEAVLSLWPEVDVQRSTIFDAAVEVRGKPFVDTLLAASNTIDQVHILPTKKPPPERRSVQKKRVVKEASQGDLWS